MQDTTVADAALESNIETGNAENNQYDAYIQETGDKHKVDPNLIHSIIKWNQIIMRIQRVMLALLD